MKNNTNIIIAVLIVLIVGIFIYSQVSQPKPVATNNNPITNGDENVIKGCYVATLGQDVYTLNLQTQVGEMVEGRLVFKNFQKDSSSGSFKGTYKDGILLGDYSFSSEGMDSVMQVIFKKVGNDFVRGYGDVNAEDTRFTDLNNITYDSSATFKATTQTCATSLQ